LKRRLISRHGKDFPPLARLCL